MFEQFDKFEEALRRYQETRDHVRKHRIKYVFGAGVVVGAIGVHLLAGTTVVVHNHVPAV